MQKLQLELCGETLRDALKVYDRDIVYEENGVLKPRLKDHVAVKESVFPFNKLVGADLLLSPEMKSTGEVMELLQILRWHLQNHKMQLKKAFQKWKSVYLFM